MKTKYRFTEEMDAQIRRVYCDGSAGRGQVRDLARRLGIPRWKVSRRAQQIGAYQPCVKEPEWSEKELKMLEHRAHLTPERIRLALRKAGFNRSTGAILIKRKRMRLLQNLKGYSARSLAECFGIDVKTVTRWIEKGWLKAEKRGTARTEAQGGDMWFIREKDLRPFVLDNVGVIDLRKVDKYWFVDIVAHGALP